MPSLLRRCTGLFSHSVPKWMARSWSLLLRLLLLLLVLGAGAQALEPTSTMLVAGPGGTSAADMITLAASTCRVAAFLVLFLSFSRYRASLAASSVRAMLAAFPRRALGAALLAVCMGVTPALAAEGTCQAAWGQFWGDNDMNAPDPPSPVTAGTQTTVTGSARNDMDGCQYVRVYVWHNGKSIGQAAVSGPSDHGAWCPYYWKGAIPPGTGNLGTVMKSADYDCNISSNGTNYQVNAPNISLNVQPQNESTFGEEVTMTATLSDSSINGQSVNFWRQDGSDWSVLGPGTVQGKQAQYKTSSLAVGTNFTLEACFADDKVCSSGVTYTVSPAPPKPTVLLSVNPSGSSTYGDQVTMTATFSNSSLNGQNAQFWRYDTEWVKLDPPKPIQGTTAVYPTSSLAVGSNLKLEACNADSSICSSEVPYTVNKATPTLTVHEDHSSGNYGDTVNLTATISPTTNTDGQVTFYEGGASLGSKALSGGSTAQLPVSNRSVGSHTFHAHFEGNDNYKEVDSSNTVSYTVNQADVASFTLTPSPGSPQPYGTEVSLTATIRPVGDTDGTIVTFYDGSTPLGHAPLQNGTTTPPVKTSSLSVATHDLKASFPGSTDYKAKDAHARYIVNPLPQAETVTTLTISPPSVGVGTSVTLTAVVTSNNHPVTKGTVNFCNAAAPLCTDINLLGTAQLSNAGPALVKLFPGIGSYALKAVFVGTTDFASSQSSSKPLAVTGKYDTETALSKAGSGPYTMTATVTGLAPPKLAPTGTVDLLDTSNSNQSVGTTSELADPQFGLDIPTPLTRLTAGKSPLSMARGDFNGDGRMDLAVANHDDTNIMIFLADSNGSLPTTTPIYWPTASPPYPIVVGDFDHNGTLDLAAGNGTNVTIYINPGSGHFSGHVDSPAGGDFADLVPGDFNRDGTLDLAVIHTSKVQVYLGDSNNPNTFTPSPGGPVDPGTHKGSYATASAAGDFNNDGFLDLAVPDGQWNGKVWVLLGDGSGAFKDNPTKVPVTSSGSDFAQSVAVGDFDGDGNLDLAAGVHNSAYSSSVRVYKGDGKADPSFTATPQTPINITDTFGVNVDLVVADFNADGIPDLASAGGSGYDNPAVRIWLGQGDKNNTNLEFTAVTPLTTNDHGGGSNPQSTIAGDFNGDGFTDIATPNAGSANVTVAYVRPSAAVTATANNVTVVGTGTHQIKATYGGDPKFAASSDSTTVGLTAQPLNTFLTLWTDPQDGSSYGQPVTITATLSPYKGQGHTTDNQIIIFKNRGREIGRRPLSGGVAEMPNYTLLPPGEAGLTAEYAGDTNFDSATATRTFPVQLPPYTTTVLQITPSPSVEYGTAVTLSAKVTAQLGGAAVTKGTVNFCNAAAHLCTDINLVGSAQLDSKGNAKVTLFPGIGAQTLKAVFVGTQDFSTSDFSGSQSAAQWLTVLGRYETETALSKAGSGPYSLTAKVTGLVPPTEKFAPSGTVDILDTSNSNQRVATTASLADPQFGLDIITPLTTLPVGNKPTSMTRGDFNGDGHMDLAIANTGANTVNVYLADEHGSFSASPASWGTAQAPYPILAGDFDNNGTLDLAIGNGSNLTVFTGDGKGGFATTGIDSPVSSDFADLVPGDFNRDGTLDLAVIHTSKLQVYLGDTKNPNRFIAAPGGQVAPGTNKGGYATASAAGDFNNDGILDLAVPDGQWNGKVWVLLGDGSGAFKDNPTKVPVTSSGSDFPQSVAVGDFNGDGNLDLAAGVHNSGYSSSVRVYKGGGNGQTFTPTPQTPINIADTFAVDVDLVVGDFNADGIPDLASAGGSSYDNPAVRIWLGKGNTALEFTAQPPLTTNDHGGGSNPQSTLAGDFNGDGFTDIATPNAGSANVSIAYVRPSAAVTATANNVPAPVGDPAKGDHNVVAHYTRDWHFAGSDSAPVHLAPAKLATTLTLAPDPLAGSVEGEPVTLSATVAVPAGVDKQGNKFGGKVSFKANGNSIGGSSVVPDPDTGVATITTTALPPGTDQLGADYSGDDNFAASTATIPYPVAAKTVTALTVAPSSIINAGSPVQLTARVMSGQTPVAHGTVNFCNASAKLCTDINRVATAQLVNGVAEATILPGIGSQQYAAMFTGTTQYAASHSIAQLLTVNGVYATSTTSTVGKPPVHALNIPVSVAVTGYVPPNAAHLPTGQVNILDTSNVDANPYTLDSTQLSTSAQYGLDVTSPLPQLSAGKSPYSIAPGDFNADGRMDIAVANHDDNNVMVYLGQANGGFGGKQTLPTTAAPYPITVGDFDNNGTLDIAVGDGSNITVFPGNGHGTFGTAVNSAVSGDFANLVPGDFDRDGKLDLAVVHTANLQVYLGDGNNTFKPTPGGTTPPGNAGTNYPSSSAAGDFNNDGILDLIVPQGDYQTHVWVLLGKGDGSFQPNPAQVPVDDGAPETVAVADFDNDGNLDFAVGVEGNSSKSTVLVFSGDGHGKNFTRKASTQNADPVRNIAVAIGDFNGDGKADLAMAGYNHQYLSGTAFGQIWLADGNWQDDPDPWPFSLALSFPPNGKPMSTIVGDFNGDGFTDVGVAAAAADIVTIGLLRPTAVVTAAVSNVPVPVGNPAKGAHQVEAAYQGDGIFAKSTSSPVPITPQKLAPTLALVPSTTAARPGQQVTLTATLAPSSGQAHTTDRETVSFKNGERQIGIGALNQGVATYATQTGDLNVGGNALTAIFAGDDNFAGASGSATVTVRPSLEGAPPPSPRAQ